MFCSHLPLWLLLCNTLLSQTHFTLPKNVWRFSLEGSLSGGRWISGGGKVDLPDEYFTLGGYGKRYYDHIIASSNDDLVGLGGMYINATDSVGKVIRKFNLSSSAGAWGDTLADFGRDFFGPDSITVGGFITDSSRRRIERITQFTLEYGLSDKFTFVVQVPYFLRLSQTNTWGWRGESSNNADMGGFNDYHTANKAKFEKLFESIHFNTLAPEVADKLRLIYDTFYTLGGRYSVLWALNGGSDPLKNGIFGSEYNPFSDEDTVATGIDSLLSFYHPDRSSSGLGDLLWGFNVLLYGSPAWAGESIFSLYAGLRMRLPTARIIEEFDENDLDSLGRPDQFRQLPLGEGVTQWQFSLFGEFYREILDRLVRFNWNALYGFNVEGKFWTRLTPRGIFSVDHSAILQRLGRIYRLKRGDVFTADIAGFLELIPDRLSLTLGQSWFFKRRDRFFSKSERWDEWMAGGTELREGYDTRAAQIIQRASLIVHNIHPLKKVGPFPFELETRVDVPFLSRHSWRRFALSLSLSVYFQFW